MTYLTFKLQDEIFAAKVEQVLEVLSEYQISAIPDAPEYIKGVINYRGEIIPAVSFREKFQFQEQSNDGEQIIVFDISDEIKTIKFGAIVDRVKNVFETNKLKERPEFGSKYNPEYLEAMIEHENDFIMLLNIKKIFNDAEIKILSEAQQKH